MIYNATPRGHVWLQWGNWWWRIERPGDVLCRAWAGCLSAAEAGDAVRAELVRRKAAKEALSEALTPGPDLDGSKVAALVRWSSLVERRPTFDDEANVAGEDDLCRCTGYDFDCNHDAMS
jgi:hypothetical protein